MSKLETTRTWLVVVVLGWANIYMLIRVEAGVRNV